MGGNASKITMNFQEGNKMRYRTLQLSGSGLDCFLSIYEGYVSLDGSTAVIKMRKS